LLYTPSKLNFYTYAETKGFFMIDQDYYDVIIIGGGSVALSTAYHAAKRHLKTLVIERKTFLSGTSICSDFALPAEQHYMSELSIVAQDYWTELQNYARETLVARNGSLWLEPSEVHADTLSIDKSNGRTTKVAAALDDLGVSYSIYNTADEIGQRFPFSCLPMGANALFQPDGGVINMQATERALFNYADQSGLVDFKEWETVIDIESIATGGVHVYTTLAEKNDGSIITYKGDKLVLALGEDLNPMIGNLGVCAPMAIRHTTVTYFRNTDPTTNFPVWSAFLLPLLPATDAALDDSTSRAVTLQGFPDVNWSFPHYVRITSSFSGGMESGSDNTSNHNNAPFQAAPSHQVIDYTVAWVKQYMPTLKPVACFTRTESMAFPEDAAQAFNVDFMSDKVVNHKNIVVCIEGCAAKLIPILGDMICQLAEDEHLTQFVYGKYSVPFKCFTIPWQVAR
jgi:glycine/D-amino acid oxidase-like deaminating enzyme